MREPYIFGINRVPSLIEYIPYRADALACNQGQQTPIRITTEDHGEFSQPRPGLLDDTSCLSSHRHLLMLSMLCLHYVMWMHHVQWVRQELGSMLRGTRMVGVMLRQERPSS